MIEKGNPFFQLIHSGMKEAISQFRDYPISVDFRHINGVDEEEYLKVLDELESKVNALIIAGLQTKRIVEKVNQIAKKIPVMTLNIDLEDEILKKVLETDKKRIICIILGPTAKVLVYDLYKNGRTAWDIGHYLKDYDAYMRKIPKTDAALENFFKPD